MEHLKATLSLKMLPGPGDPGHEVLKGSKLPPRDPMASGCVSKDGLIAKRAKNGIVLPSRTGEWQSQDKKHSRR